MAPWAWPWVPCWEDRQTGWRGGSKAEVGGGQKDKKIVEFLGLLAMSQSALGKSENVMHFINFLS